MSAPAEEAAAQASELESIFGPVISQYTRAQAIADGFLVDVSETAREAGIKFPVALTRAVWDKCVEIPAGVDCQDERGRLWDVVGLLRWAIRNDGNHDMEIKLFGGEIAHVSREDGTLAKRASWHLNNGYAAAVIDGGTVYLHQLVLPAPPGYEVDHRDGNKLNNRRSNLRLVTRSQQMMNTRLRTDNKSGFRGVSWDEQTKKWRARLVFEGKTHNLGRFDTEMEAASVYAEAANKFCAQYLRRDGSVLHYRVRVRNRPKAIRLDRRDDIELKAVCGPGDTAEPTITVMLPHES